MQDTSNRAPGLHDNIRSNQHDINSAPGVGDAAPRTAGKADVGGDTVGSLPGSSSGSAFKHEAKEQQHHDRSNQHGSSVTADGSLDEATIANSDEYPPQRHAGAVGYGPNYKTGPSLGDKVGGMTEKIIGKVTKNEEKIHHGEARQAGRLDEENHAAEEARQNPLNNPVKGDASLSGSDAHANPDDSKGLASKRLGEDSAALGSSSATTTTPH